jgi:hypothetical protein
MNVPATIEVVSKKCMQCPDLEIDTITRSNVIVDKVHENGDIEQHTECYNIFRCVNYFKCKTRFQTIMGCDPEDAIEETYDKAEKPALKKKPGTAKNTETAKKPDTRNKQAVK